MMMTNVLPGSVCKVLVTSANVNEDGSLIVWGHALVDENDNDDTFAQFHDDLQEGIQVSRKAPTTFAKNELCAALFMEDNAWYRAKFLYKYSDDEWVVQFTDYGNEEVVKVKDMAEIPMGYRKLPDQALAFIITEGLNPQHNAGTWNPNAAKALKENFLYQILDVTITSRVSDGRYTGTNKEMTDRLIKDNFCTRGLAFPKSLFAPGAVVPCFVSYLSHNLTVFLQPTSRKDQLKASMQDLNDFFNVRNNRLSIDKNELQVGAIVAGIYSVDCLYYRVRVNEVYKDSCMVSFIDYGGQEKIDFVELWKLPEKFSKPDYFGVESKFSDITLKNSEDALQKVCEHLLSDVLEVTVTHSSDPPIPISATINGSSVEGKFLAEGLAIVNNNGKLESSSALNKPFIGSDPRTPSKLSYETEQSSLKFKRAPKDAYYSPLVFKRGDHEEVVITNVESVENISVRLHKNEDKFKNFQANLKNLYPICVESLKLFRVVDVSVGDAVAIRPSTKNCYYRGEIIEVLDGAKALVSHVDFGCRKVYSLSELLLPAVNFFEIPVQTITCTLCRICNLNSKTQNDVLATTFLNKSYRAIFAGYQDGCHFVEFYMMKLGNANTKFGILTNSLLRDVPFIELPDEIKSLYVEHPGSTSPSKAPLRKLESPSDTLLVENASLKRIIITHIEDPVCFWYQNPCIEDLKSLQLSLNKIYDWTPEDELYIKKIEVGEKCCVKYTHEQLKAWRRGSITYHFGDCVNVRLIDYGEEVQVHKRDVKMLFEKFETIPPYANEAKLFNIKPMSKRWEKETTQSFKKLVNLSKATYAEEISADSDCGHVLKVVCDTGRYSRYVDIGESLINCQQAQWADVTAAYSKMTEEKSAITTTVVTSSSVGEKKKDSAPPKSRAQYSILTHVLLGKTVRVTKGQVVSPKEFFLCVQDLSDSCQFNTLSKKLDKTKIPLLTSDVHSLYVGMPCKIKIQTGWRRCALMEYSDPSNCEVCLVDCGKIVRISMDEVFAIDRDLVSCMPPAAIRCTLNGIVRSHTITNEWGDEATQALKTFFDNSQSLFCTVRCYAADDSGLYFICNVKSDGDTADDYLLQKGVAKRCGSISDLPSSMQLNSFDVSSATSVTVGKGYSLQVTHVCKDSVMFYCQRSESLLVVEAIMKNLQIAVEKTRADESYDAIMKRGLICAVRYQDGLWYRAHLMESFQKDSSTGTRVHLVDYGIDYVVTSKDIKFGVANTLVDIPIQAFRCCLSDVRPGEFTEKNRQLVSDDLKKTISQKLLRGTVVGRDDDCVLLDLFEEDGKRVNERVRTLYAPRTTPCVGSYAPETSIMRFRNELKETVPIEKGDVLDAFLSDSMNPYEFHLILNEFERQRKEFKRVLDGGYNALRSMDYVVTKMLENELVCVNRNAGWCRALILRVLKNNLALVQDLDTGSIFSAEMCDMKQLVRPMGGKCPRFAVKCALTGVLPTKSGGQWSEEAKDKFKKSNQHVLLRVTFTDYDSHKDIWSVKLFKPNGDSCAEVLAKEGLAILEETKTEVPQTIEPESNREPISPTQSKLAVKEEEKEVFNVSVKEASFNEPKPVVKEEPQQQKKVSITAREMNFKQPPQVYISFVESSSCFYVQLVSEYESLMTMMTEVNTEEVTKSLSQIKSLQLETGDACLSIYPEDGMYYRGKLLEIKDSGEMDIFYVDYGNTSTVPSMSLYHLPKSYVDPEFAIKCVLSDSDVKVKVPNMIEELGQLSAAEDLKIFADFMSDAKTDVARLSIEQGGETLSLDEYLSKKLNLSPKPEPLCQQEVIDEVAEKETCDDDKVSTASSDSQDYKDAYDMHKSSLIVTQLKIPPSSGVKTTTSLPDVGALDTVAPLKVESSKSVEAFTTPAAPEETDNRSEEEMIKSFKPTLDSLTKAALTSPFNPEKFTVIPLDRFYEKVLVEISELCKTEVAKSNPTKSVAKFDYCITKHECLKATKPSYHRAKVTAVHSNNSMVSVRFIDCGHLGRVPQKDVKVITNAALLAFPSMSVQCQLENWEAFSAQIGYLKALQKVLSVYPMQVIFTGHKTGDSWVVQLLFDEWVICKLVISTNAPLLPIPEIPEKEPACKLKICKDKEVQTSEVAKSNNILSLPSPFIPSSVSTPNLPQPAVAAENGQQNYLAVPAQSGKGDAPDQTYVKSNSSVEEVAATTGSSSVDCVNIYTSKRSLSSADESSSIPCYSLSKSEKECMNKAIGNPFDIHQDSTTETTNASSLNCHLHP